MLLQSDVICNDVACSIGSEGNISDEPGKHQATQQQANVCGTSFEQCHLVYNTNTCVVYILKNKSRHLQ